MANKLDDFNLGIDTNDTIQISCTPHSPPLAIYSPSLYVHLDIEV